MKLSLDSLTVTDTEPVDLIRGAKSAGFDLVSLWVQPPPIFPLQLVTPAKAKACAAALAETGIGVGALEVFVLGSAEAIKSYRPALELGARLGGKTASAININNANPVELSELFAQFAELAREYGLGVTLEPLAMFETATLAQARDIIRGSRVDAGIVLDAFHLVRKGGTAADVRAIEPGLIRYIQLCDGAASVTHEQMHYEASYERLYPGDGAFPLVEIFSNVPTDVTWGIEAPSRRRAAQGMSAEMQAREAMTAMRRVIDQIPAARKSLGR
ncbi:MAG TPA: sugar phosphate isomerase/epimerase [Steroidobacteraceae bacterium]|nr:sugar phosphate isomerase/epimerase [Steroidobacteraceae bacterium]